jgi:hypothetical protein
MHGSNVKKYVTDLHQTLKTASRDFQNAAKHWLLILFCFLYDVLKSSLSYNSTFSSDSASKRFPVGYAACPEIDLRPTVI